jgi:hypothetical protein
LKLPVADAPWPVIISCQATTSVCDGHGRNPANSSGMAKWNDASRDTTRAFRKKEDASSQAN